MERSKKPKGKFKDRLYKRCYMTNLPRDNGQVDKIKEAVQLTQTYKRKSRHNQRSLGSIDPEIMERCTQSKEICMTFTFLKTEIMEWSTQ